VLGERTLRCGILRDQGVLSSRWPIRDSWRNALLAATVVCLAATIGVGYLTRLRLVEKDSWVAHTVEVKLAIADCELALARGDAARVRAAEGIVQRLTVDNPVQQRAVARAVAVTVREAVPHDDLDALFESMSFEEDRLMTVRLGEMDAARQRSTTIFLVGAVLTFLFGVLGWAVQRAQTLSLAATREALTRDRALLQAVLESVDEGIIAVDASRKTIAINGAARVMVGAAYPLNRLPHDWRPLLTASYEDGRAMAPEEGPLARAMRGESPDDVVYKITPIGGEASAGTWVSTTARPIRDAGGNIVAAVATLRDITQQRETALRLRDLSLTDELTGLLNRRGFLAAANARVLAARRTGAFLALLYADLDGLKRINDELGHEQGDRAIADTGQVFRGVFRDGDVVARIGGDEFVALLSNFAPTACDALLERLAEAARTHSARETRPFRLSISAGLTFMDGEREQSLEELLAEADRCMYERKRERAAQ
jgi:diguanylate cyclase (GGDEF)-like protein